MRLLRSRLQAQQISPQDGEIQEGLRRVQMEQKKASRKNYYAILVGRAKCHTTFCNACNRPFPHPQGTTEGASQAEIKKAYRKKALEWHP